MILEYIDAFFTQIINIRNRFAATLIGSIKDNKIQQYSYSHILPMDAYKLFIEKPYIYKLHEKYHISDNKFNVIPILNQVKLVNDTQELDITDIIKNYDNSISLWMVLYIENLDVYDKIIIKINRIVYTEEKEYSIKDVRMKKLYEIYNNKHLDTEENTQNNDIV